MTVSEYFGQKCVELIRENVSLVLQKLSDPSSLVSVKAEGALVDAAKAGMGPLSAFAGEYVSQNASGLAVEALQAVGLKDDVQQAFDMANNVMAAAIMANNEIIMFFVRNVAKQALKDIEEKQKKVEELAAALAVLYNLLIVLNKGNPSYELYLTRQRQALRHVLAARSDLLLTRNTFKAQNRWLARSFSNAKKELGLAQDLILPSQNNPGIAQAVSGADKMKSAFKNDYQFSKQSADGRDDVVQGVKSVLGTLLEDTPIPTTAEQMQAIAAIPRASSLVLKAAQEYFEINLRLNSKLNMFKAAYGNIQSSLPNYFKKYILSLFDPALTATDKLAQSMAQTLNGGPNAWNTPVAGFRPKTSVVTVMGFKWAMDINLIFQTFNTIPEGSLNALNVSRNTLDAYTNCVQQIKRMGTIRTTDVVIEMNEGEESIGDLETQLILFLLEANNAIVSSEMKKSSLNVATAMLRRMRMTTGQLGRLSSILQEFVDTPFALQDATMKAGEGILKMFKDAGLDNAVSALNEGNFNKFFKLSPKESTAVGAALVVVAALKQCFPDDATREKLSQIQFEFEKDEDLLNLKFNLDFDLAILKNLKDCARATSLANSFKLDEILCGIVGRAQTSAPEASRVAGASLSKIADVLSF